MTDSDDVEQWTTDNVIGLLTNNSVATASIQAEAVTTAKLADDSVTADKLRDDASTDGNRAVTTDHIRDDAVTADKLRDDASTDGNRSVTTNHVRDNAITNSKLDSAVQNALAPAGSMMAYGGTSAPGGWLICDGTAVSRSTYSDLYAVLGDAYGEGDGSTTFHLPDLRGRFIRGVDDSEGNDPDAGSRTASNTGGNTGDNVGSLQTDAFQGHWHADLEADTGEDVDFLLTGRASGGGTVMAQSAGSSNVRVKNPMTDGSNGTPRTTEETRPVNVYCNYIIKT